MFDSLENDFFDLRHGHMGLYRPTALVICTQGFFFGLYEYDARKTQVLFIHGIGGNPRDLKFIVEGMDRSLFQPCDLYAHDVHAGSCQHSPLTDGKATCGQRGWDFASGETG